MCDALSLIPSTLKIDFVLYCVYECVSVWEDVYMQLTMEAIGLRSPL